LAVCSAITRAGTRCKGTPIDASGLCFVHHPEHVEARKRAGRKGGKRGGRGRPVVELANIKAKLEDLAESVLEGEVDRGDAAVAGQLLNYAVGAMRAGLKAKEVEEIEGRLEELEALLAQRGAG
jgi:hypothetical protein